MSPQIVSREELAILEKLSIWLERTFSPILWLLRTGRGLWVEVSCVANDLIHPDCLMLPWLKILNTRLKGASWVVTLLIYLKSDWLHLDSMGTEAPAIGTLLLLPCVSLWVAGYTLVSNTIQNNNYKYSAFMSFVSHSSKLSSQGHYGKPWICSWLSTSAGDLRALKTSGYHPKWGSLMELSL